MSDERLSGSTFFLKRVFPLLWFGLLAYFVAMAFFFGKPRGEDMVGVAVAALLMTVVGLVVMKKFVWDLADEVLLRGDALIVRKGGDEERIRLADIINVNCNQFSNPKRISLRLRKPCRFGDDVTFMPRTNFNFNPFARDQIAEKLIRLADQARQDNR